MCGTSRKLTWRGSFEPSSEGGIIDLKEVCENLKINMAEEETNMNLFRDKRKNNWLLAIYKIFNGDIKYWVLFDIILKIQTYPLKHRDQVEE